LSQVTFVVVVRNAEGVTVMSKKSELDKKTVPPEK